MTEITQAELEDKFHQLEALHEQLEAKRRWIVMFERHIYLCFAAVYLGGIVMGVVIAKRWWSL